MGLGVPHYCVEGTWLPETHGKGHEAGAWGHMGIHPFPVFRAEVKGRLAVAVSFSDETHLLSWETNGCPSVGCSVEGAGSACLQVQTPVAPCLEPSLSLSPHIKMREGF